MKIMTRWLALLVIVALALWIKQSGFFEFALSVMHKMGVWAVPAFLSVYVLSCLFFFPSLIMTSAAGILFPVPLAIILSLAGTTIGSVSALLIGRYGLRDVIQKAAGQNPQFQKLDEAIRREGWKIAVLARLTPVFPFSVGNYLFGASSIPAWLYGLTAFFGTIPSASVYSFLGHLYGNVSDKHERTPLEWGLLAVGIIATLILSAYMKRFFNHMFEEESISPKKA